MKYRKPIRQTVQITQEDRDWVEAEVSRGTGENPAALLAGRLLARLPAPTRWQRFRARIGI